MKSLLLAFCALLLCSSLLAQTVEKTVKKVPAVRTTQKIVIDGDLKDEAWKSCPHRHRNGGMAPLIRQDRRL
jgi:metallophosphoesterase superfamily enzyme